MSAMTMIKTQVTKQQLLRQLPEKAGYALLQWFEEMPQTFVFEAMLYETPMDRLSHELPEVHKVMTAVEWHMFSVLYLAKHPVRHSLLFISRNPREEMSAFSNIVHVHVKNLRIKLQKHNFPWAIKTHKKNIICEGAFELVKI